MSRRFDIHLSLEWLFGEFGDFGGGGDEGRSAEQIGGDVRPIPGGVEGSAAINLFTTTVPKDRSCAGAGIYAKSCVCRSWEPLDTGDHRATQAVAAAVENINSHRAGYVRETVGGRMSRSTANGDTGVRGRAKGGDTSTLMPVRCKRCKAGGAEDGGIELDADGICLGWCSRGGSCGTGADYKSGASVSDCRPRDSEGLLPEGLGWPKAGTTTPATTAPLNDEAKDAGGGGGAAPSCKEVVLEEVLMAKIKPKVVSGYLKNGQDERFPDLVVVEFTGTAHTRWRAICTEDGANSEVIELQAMHRYSKRKACTDGSAPLKYCACEVAGGSELHLPTAGQDISEIHTPAAKLTTKKEVAKKAKSRTKKG